MFGAEPGLRSEWSSDIEGTLLHSRLESFHSLLLWPTFHPHPQIQTDEANPIPQWVEFAGHVEQRFRKFAGQFDASMLSSNS